MGLVGFSLAILCCGVSVEGSLYPITGVTDVSNLDAQPATVGLNTGATVLGYGATGVFKTTKDGGLTAQSSSIVIHSWSGPDLNYLTVPSGSLSFKREDAGSALLSTVGNDVSTAFGLSSFTPTKMVVVQYSGYTADGTDGATNPSNAFQQVIITDVTDTYLILNYPAGEMNWWKDDSNVYPTISVTVDTVTLLTLAGSNTAAIQDTIEAGNTYTAPGKLFYKIDGACDATCDNAAPFYVRSCKPPPDAHICICSPCVEAAATTTPPETETTGDSSCLNNRACLIPATLIPSAIGVATVISVTVYLVNKAKAAAKCKAPNAGSNPECERNA